MQNAKWRCRRDSVATFPVGPDGAGEGNVALTPAATMPCRAAAKAWRAESDRTRAARPMAGAGCACCFPSPCGNHPPGWKPCVVGVGGVDEACVHPPQYLATKISLGVTPYFPNVENFMGPLRSLLCPQSPPCCPPCACRHVWGGVWPFRSLRPECCQGFPPSCQIQKYFWARCCCFQDPSCLPAPPPLCL